MLLTEIQTFDKLESGKWVMCILTQDVRVRSLCCDVARHWPIIKVHLLETSSVVRNQILTIRWLYLKCYTWSALKS